MSDVSFNYSHKFSISSGHEIYTGGIYKGGGQLSPSNMTILNLTLPSMKLIVGLQPVYFLHLQVLMAFAVPLSCEL